MCWWLVGFCGIALINMSVALADSPVMVLQWPRFYGVTAKEPGIFFSCDYLKKDLTVSAEWYRAAEYNTTKYKLIAGGKITFSNRDQVNNSILHIQFPQVNDSGVYFCKIQDNWGPGSQLQVARHINYAKARSRTNMKDGLIVLQGLLLAVCIAALLLRKQTLLEKMDSEYEEPETDHIYEGLTIETCGGGLYEELSVYAQADGAEAPWE